MARNNMFYERLREIAKDKNLSLTQASKDLGYPKNTLNNYSSGKQPSGKRLLEVAHYLNTSPEYLLGMIDDKKEDAPEAIFLRSSEEDLAVINYFYQKVYLKNNNYDGGNHD